MSHSHTVVLGMDPGAGIALGVARGDDQFLRTWPREVVSPALAMWSVIDTLADEDSKASIRLALADMAVTGIEGLQQTVTCPLDDQECAYPDVIHDVGGPFQGP